MGLDVNVAWSQADAKAKAANKRRRSSTSSAGPAAKRSANGINQAQVKAMEKLRTQILDLPDDVCGSPVTRCKFIHAEHARQHGHRGWPSCMR